MGRQVFSSCPPFPILAGDEPLHYLDFPIGHPRKEQVRPLSNPLLRSVRVEEVKHLVNQRPDRASPPPRVYVGDFVQAVAVAVLVSPDEPNGVNSDVILA